MKIILAGGATGGHIYPAIAIADKIKRKNKDAEFLFLGAKKELGSNIVTDNGYEIKYVNTRGFDRKNLLKNISVVKDLIISNMQIKKILDDFDPDIVIGTGGYVCGPVIRAAKKKGIKTYIHEQNVIPGMANKMAEKYADKVFVGFPEGVKYFKNKEKIVVTGNPVRSGFITAKAVKYREKLKIDEKDLVILIFGGSRGADKINELTQELLEKIKNEKDISVFFITGTRQYDEVINNLESKDILKNSKVHVMDYTEEIHKYFAASDIIISRSGALTVSEITVSGKCSILIPSPNVTNNHQYFNAKPLADKGAAIVIEEKDLTVDKLYNEIMQLKINKDKLNKMSTAAEKIGNYDATGLIFDNLEM